MASAARISTMANSQHSLETSGTDEPSTASSQYTRPNVYKRLRILHMSPVGWIEVGCGRNAAAATGDREELAGWSSNRRAAASQNQIRGLVTISIYQCPTRWTGFMCSRTSFSVSETLKDNRKTTVYPTRPTQSGVFSFNIQMVHRVAVDLCGKREGARDGNTFRTQTNVNYFSILTIFEVGGRYVATTKPNAKARNIDLVSSAFFKQ